MSLPRFAVLGPPNKGKSCIVAALARDESIGISDTPCTTVSKAEYPMKVDGRTLYVLYDTPGFQRARRVLDWLKSKNASPTERPSVIREFVEVHTASNEFRDECELLAPLIEETGIIYVVDGSVPYGDEYLPEMEILQWTGRPRMALINPIGPADHIREWETALGQFFNLTRVFNPLSADFTRQSDLLQALGELHPAWKPSLTEALEFLRQDRRNKRERSADIITDMLVEMITHRIEKNLPIDGDVQRETRSLEEEFQKHLQKLEIRARRRVEELYHHVGIERLEAALPALQSSSLFSDASWRLFGLDRKTLASLGAASGAIAGGVIDVAVGGSSLLAGSLIGAGAGALSAFIGGHQLSKVRILNREAGRKQLTVGPILKTEFAHMVFERARVHHSLVANRSHAMRNKLDLNEISNELLESPERGDLQQLNGCFHKIPRQDPSLQRATLRQSVLKLLAG